MYSNYKPQGYNAISSMLPPPSSYVNSQQYPNQQVGGSTGGYVPVPMMGSGMTPHPNMSMPPPVSYPLNHPYQAQQVQQSPWASADKLSMSTSEPEPDPDMYETCVYLGIDDGDGFDFRTRVIGEKGENLDYMRRSTGAKVLLRGKGSGVYNNRPPHIFISHATLQGMTDAEKLATNLVNVIKEDYQEFKAKQDHGISRSQSSSIVVDYDHSRSSSMSANRGMLGQDRDMMGLESRSQSSSRFEDGSLGRPARNYSENGRSSQMGQQQRDRPQSLGYLEDSQSRRSSSVEQSNRYPLGRSDSSRNEQYMGNNQQAVEFYCDLCNVNCPNKQMYTLHCKGVMHTDKTQGQRERQQPSREMSQSITDDVGGTHWEGTPDNYDGEQNWQGSSSGTIEDYVFNQCERLLKTMIGNTTLRNLKRSVEKIGQRDLKSAIPNKPQSSYYCKLCKEDVLDMQQHLGIKAHGNLYLLRQIQLGDLFIDYYSDVPIPGVITNGGRVLAMDTLTFGPCIPETNRERFKELLVYSGAYLAYKCSVCVTNIATLGNWVQHITSKKHGKRCIEVMLQNGIKYFMEKNPHIPIPPPKNALEIINTMDIAYIHPSLPQTRRSSRGAVSESSSSRQMNSTYQLLVALPSQDRQLVLQVQALTGIDDLSLIINVLAALGNMDPAMLQTLSALDPLAIQHAMAGNMAFQGMEVSFVQQVIKMYLNYKGVSTTVNIPQQQMRYQQQIQQRSHSQPGIGRDDSRSRGDPRGGRSMDRRPGSRWDDGFRDDRRDRSIDRPRGRLDRSREDFRPRFERGRMDTRVKVEPKRDSKPREKPDKDKRVDSKEKKKPIVTSKNLDSNNIKADIKGKKTDKDKTDTKEKKVVKPVTSGKRSAEKAGPKAKKPCPAIKDGKSGAAEHKKTDSKDKSSTETKEPMEVIDLSEEGTDTTEAATKGKDKISDLAKKQNDVAEKDDFSEVMETIKENEDTTKAADEKATHVDMEIDIAKPESEKASKPETEMVSKPETESGEHFKPETEMVSDGEEDSEPEIEIISKPETERKEDSKPETEVVSKPKTEVASKPETDIVLDEKITDSTVKTEIVKEEPTIDANPKTEGTVHTSSVEERATDGQSGKESIVNVKPEVSPVKGELTSVSAGPVTRSPRARARRGRGRGRGVVRKGPARKTRGSVMVEAQGDCAIVEHEGSEPDAKKVKEEEKIEKKIEEEKPEIEKAAGDNIEIKASSDIEETIEDVTEEIDEDVLLGDGDDDDDDDDMAGLETVDEI